MNEAAAKPIGRLSQTRELLCGQAPARNLDALHLHSLLALSIGAKMQTQLLHLRLVNFTRAIFRYLLLVISQLFADVCRQGLRFSLGSLDVHFFHMFSRAQKQKSRST